MDALQIAQLFNYSGKLKSCSPYGNGHINDTFLLVFKSGCRKEHRYILQKINGNVFKDSAGVMENISGVTEYLRRMVEAEGGDPEREVLNVIKTADGRNYYIDENGNYWRSFAFIAGTVSLDRCESKNDFYQSAVAFGRFQRMLKDYPAETLNETIKDFHNTPKRYKVFLEAVSKDVCGRAAGVMDEIEFVKSRKDFMSVLIDANKNGVLPLKVTHNDTKLNNVLLDVETREPVCVIDLDTIMPGFSVTDFGDSIRFGASTAVEDEKDLSLVHFDLGLFETYTDGFLKGCGGTLTDGECELLPEGAKMMTLECGMRFLADYLSGDTYFKTAYPEHNLVRCRTQFRLVSEMEEHWDEMKNIVKKYK